MLTNHAACVFTVRTRFGTEARCLSGNLDRQIAFFEHLTANGVCERNFRSRDEVEDLAFAFLAALLSCKQVFFEFRKLAGTDQGFLISNVRCVALCIAVFLSMSVKHKLSQSSVKTSNLAFHEAEACSGKLSADVKVEAQRTADIDVILDFKIEFARCAPAADLTFSVSSLPTGTEGSGRFGIVKRRSLRAFLTAAFLPPRRPSLQR